MFNIGLSLINDDGTNTLSFIKLSEFNEGFSKFVTLESILKTVGNSVAADVAYGLIYLTGVKDGNLCYIIVFRH